VALTSAFEMRFPVLLCTLGEPWITTETADVSATGAMFLTERLFLLNPPVEYVSSSPPELTKATQPLLVRFLERCCAVSACLTVTDSTALRFATAATAT
jgi:hypothetical protein